MQSASSHEKSDQDDSGPKTTLISRNITVMGRRTSVRLEPEMWQTLREIAKREKCSIHDICSLIDLRKNDKTSLTAAIRVFLMLYFRAATTEEGHRKAGHGSFDVMKQRARIDERSVPSFSKRKKPGYADGSEVRFDKEGMFSAAAH